MLNRGIQGNEGQVIYQLSGEWQPQLGTTAGWEGAEVVRTGMEGF